MSVLNNNSGIYAGSCKPMKKCAIKINKERRKNDAHEIIILMEGSSLYGCYAKR